MSTSASDISSPSERLVLVMRRCGGYQLECRGYLRVFRYWLRAQLINVLRGRIIQPLSLDMFAPYLYRKGKCSYTIYASPEAWRDGRLLQCPQCGSLMIIAHSPARNALMPVPLRRKDVRQLPADVRKTAGYVLFWILTR